MIGDTSLAHLHLNRSKQSIFLDLKTDRGKQAFLEHVTNSDAVVEGMRPGFLERLGLGFERLVVLNPSLVLVTLSGYGLTGPYQGLPSHGTAFDAWAGLVTPQRRDDGTGYQLPDMPSIGQNVGPLYGAIGLLAAVVHARATGHGSHLEVAQADAAAAIDWYRIESWRSYESGTATVPPGEPIRPPGPAALADAARYQVYAAADGFILMMTTERWYWERFCSAVGREDLVRRFPGDDVDYAAGNDQLRRELVDLFASRSVAQWTELARSEGLPICPVNTPSALSRDPQFHERLPWLPASELGTDQLPLPIKAVGGARLPDPTRASSIPTRAAG